MTDQLKQRPGDQPLPVPNETTDIQTMVIDDLQGFPDRALDVAQRVAGDVAARRAVGIQRYGTALQAGNGRDAIRDLYEEVLDAMVYARQAITEGVDRDQSAAIDVYVRLQGLALSVRGISDRREVDRG